MATENWDEFRRGYTPTEAGQDVFAVAQETDDQLSQLVSRIKGRGEEITGELVITVVPSLSRIIVPVIAAFQREHPGLRVRFLSDMRIYRLEYGEAHIALRAGRPPEEPDNVVQKFLDLEIGLYVHRDYAARFEGITGEALFDHVNFVTPDGAAARAPFSQWLEASVAPERIVFRATELQSLKAGILEGIGAGFLMCTEAERHDELVQVLPPRPEWLGHVWLVTHVDLHRTTKVQAFLKHLKAHMLP